MKVEIRIYKLFDTDLVAMVDNGYPVCEMMRRAVIGYANASPVCYKMDEHLYFNMNGKQNVRLRFTVTDKKTIALLKGIKHGYRNSFCKMVLRNALSCQNLSCYFSEEKTIELHRENTDMEQKDTINVSTIRKIKNPDAVISTIAANVKKQPIKTKPEPKPAVQKDYDREHVVVPSVPVLKTDDVMAMFDAL